MYLIKEDKIKEYKTINDKVICTVLIDNHTITNPTLQQMLDNGWEIYVIKEVEVEQLNTIENLVEMALREGVDGGSPLYSLNQELKAQRERDENPEQFNIYNNRVKQCIAWAHSQPHEENIQPDL